MLTSSSISFRLGFSHSLSPESKYAIHDAAGYIFANESIKRAFMRGHREGVAILHEVKRDITNGSTVFVRDCGEYDGLMAGKITLDQYLDPLTPIYPIPEQTKDQGDYFANEYHKAN